MSSKHYAYIFLALYAVVLLFAFRFGKFSARPNEQAQSDIIYIEYVKPEPPVRPKPIPQPKDVKETPRKEVIAPRNNAQQVSGEKEVTRTVNKRALFKMNNDGTDKPESGGNPKAKQDTVTTASGKGEGLNPVGNEALDMSLQERGLVGTLPQPIYPAGNKSGKVVVKVNINQAGVVTEASYVPKGSTTSDKALVDAALKAARQARFTQSKEFYYTGHITYVFIIK